MNASGEASPLLDPPTIAMADPKDRPYSPALMSYQDAQITESYQFSQIRGTQLSGKDYDVCTINFVPHRLLVPFLETEVYH